MKKRVRRVLSLLVGTVVGIVVGTVGTSKKIGKQIGENKQMSDKHLALFLMMNQWVKVKQEGKNLADYFEKKGYREIAIYGMSYAGETLVDELVGSDIKIKYGIDRKADNIYASINLVSPEDFLEKVDAVIVTSITFYDEIEEKLSEKVECPIISLEDILYDI